MLLPLSRFFRPSAPILGDKTKQEKQLLYVLGKQGESHYTVLESALIIHKPLSRVPTTLVAPILHQGLFLEREALFQHILSQTIFASHHCPRNSSCCQKAASNQLPVHYRWYNLPGAELDAHLTDRHSADAGVQESCGRVGTHFTHKGEFLFPADTVFLNFLSMRMKKKIQTKGQSQIETSS